MQRVIDFGGSLAAVGAYRPGTASGDPAFTAGGKPPHSTSESTDAADVDEVPDVGVHLDASDDIGGSDALFEPFDDDPSAGSAAGVVPLDRDADTETAAVANG